jgi:protein-L-isoaspartate(D-aspartate) O-methyltransferase
MKTENDDLYTQARSAMVDLQIAHRGISDLRLLAVMRQVPRHLFVPRHLWGQAYNDYPLPIGEDQTISQPYIVALMTEALELRDTDRVLEIGTGSGYQAAILAALAREVFSIERLPSLAHNAERLLDSLGSKNVQVRVGDGTLGWPEAAPFDAILVTAGSPQVPPPLIEQLGLAGRLVIPVGNHYSQSLTRLRRTKEGNIKTENLGGCRFVRLVGRHGWDEARSGGGEFF